MLKYFNLTYLKPIYQWNFSPIPKYFGMCRSSLVQKIADFISTLKSPEFLSNTSMYAVIEALQRLYLQDFVGSPSVPDIFKILVHIDQFASKRCDPRDIRYAHPEIPSEISDYYGIPQYEDDLVVIRHLSGPDVLKSIGKFCYKDFKGSQRLLKALKEVSLWYCLNEFLANVEDCGC